MKGPYITIVIPCYFQAHFLHRSLGSVADQMSSELIEIIVVDDGSPDDVPSQLLPYKNVIYLRKCNGGLASARNYGLARATGLYVVFLDADDVFCEGTLQEACAFLAAEEPDVALCPSFDVYDDGRICPGWCSELPEDTYHFLLSGGRFPVHSAFVRRELLSSVAGFDESLQSCEDWDLWLRLVQKGAQIRKLDCNGVLYNRRSGSMSSDGLRMWISGHQVLEKHVGFHPCCRTCDKCRRTALIDLFDAYLIPTIFQCKRPVDLPLMWAFLRTYGGLVLLTASLWVVRFIFARFRIYGGRLRLLLSR